MTRATAWIQPFVIRNSRRGALDIGALLSGGPARLRRAREIRAKTAISRRQATTSGARPDFRGSRTTLPPDRGAPRPAPLVAPCPLTPPPTTLLVRHGSVRRWNPFLLPEAGRSARGNCCPLTRTRRSSLCSGRHTAETDGRRSPSLTCADAFRSRRPAPPDHVTSPLGATGGAGDGRADARQLPGHAHAVHASSAASTTKNRRRRSRRAEARSRSRTSYESGDDRPDGRRRGAREPAALSEA